GTGADWLLGVIRRASLLAIVVSAVVLTCGAARKPSGKPAFVEGEASLRKGDLITAYRSFSDACTAEPNNEKFKKKRTEVGRKAALQLAEEGQAAINKSDLALANDRISLALHIDPACVRAKELDAELKKRVAAMDSLLHSVQAAVCRGEISTTAGDLRTSLESYWSKYSEPYDLLTKEMQSVRDAERLRSAVARG